MTIPPIDISEEPGPRTSGVGSIRNPRTADGVRADLVVDDSEFRRSAAHESHWLEVAEPAALTWLEERELLAPDRVHARRFVATVLATAVVVVAGVTAFNLMVDPRGDARGGSGSGEVPREVEEKLDQLEALAAAPDTVVLGSSVVMKYDPRDADELLGGRTHNAGVSSARPSVLYAMASYLSERFGEQMPNLLIGVNNFIFTAGAGDDAYLTNDPRLARQVEQLGTWQRIEHLASFASLHLARSSWTKLRGAEDGDPHAARGGSSAAGTGSRRRLFDERGFLVREYSTDQRVIDRRTTRDVNRYRATLTRWYESGAQLDADQLDYFERMVALAVERGRRPVVVLVPFNPVATRGLAGPAFDAKRDAVIDALHEMQSRHEFDVLDLRDVATIGGSESDFYDASHISPEAARRVLEQVAEATR